MSQKPSKVVLVGCGAQARYALETFALTGVEVVAIFDPIGHCYGKTLEGCSILSYSGPAAVREAAPDVTDCLVCIANCDDKARIYWEMKQAGYVPVSAIHPTAVIARRADIGGGVIINALAVVQPDVRVGDGTMIHAGVVLEHDVVLEPFVNVAPGVCLAGRVRVGRGSTIYTNATVAPNKTIGPGAIVGAGAVVLSDIPADSKVAGIPARDIKK